MKISPLAMLDALEALPPAVVPLDRARAQSLGSSTRADEAFAHAVEALFTELEQKRPNPDVVAALIEVLEHVTGSPGALSSTSPANPEDPGIYFASGSNRVSMIRGVTAAGRAVGVAANEIRATSEAELHKLAGTGIPVFVDSGAFGEVQFNAPHEHRKNSKACREGTCPGAGKLPFPREPAMTFVATKPITHEAWQKVLGLYARLGKSLGPQLYVVAPDRVGDQVQTAERLKRYATQLRELRKTGAHIIVALQRANPSVPGSNLTSAAFDRKVEKILGFDDYVRGIPSKKGATTVAELKAFVTDLRKRVAQPRVHLLGKGLPFSKAAERAAYIDALQGVSVTADSVRLLAICGEGRGLYEMRKKMEKKHGRALTEDEVADAVKQAFMADPRGASSVFEFTRVSPRIRIVQCKLRANAGPKLFLIEDNDDS